MAMSDLRNYISATLIPLNIVDLAVANLNTAVALTEQAVTQFVPTETNNGPTNTASLTPCHLIHRDLCHDYTEQDAAAA
jgi:hypothetical protein